MFIILCKDLTSNVISMSNRLFFEGQVDEVLKELNNQNNNCIYYKQEFTWA